MLADRVLAGVAVGLVIGSGARCLGGSAHARRLTMKSSVVDSFTSVLFSSTLRPEKRPANRG